MPCTDTNLYVALSCSIAYSISIHSTSVPGGGLLNSAATFALALCGDLPVVHGVLFFSSQLLGGTLAAATVRVIVPGNMQALQTRLGPYVRIAQGLFLEMLPAAILVFTILQEKHKQRAKSTLVIGFAYFVAQLAGGPYTGAALNPVRSLAPCIATGKSPSYHWIYWISPFVGSILASISLFLVRNLKKTSIATERNPWLPSESSPLLQTTYSQTESPGPASPRMSLPSPVNCRQRNSNDSQESGDEYDRKQHHARYPYYRYRRDGRLDLAPKQDSPRPVSDGKIFERTHDQEPVQQLVSNDGEPLLKSRGKERAIALDV